MASLSEQLRAQEAPSEAANVDAAFDPASMVSAAALRAAEDAGKKDVSTFKDVLQATGTGLYNLAAMAAGLPTSIVKWLAQGSMLERQATEAAVWPGETGDRAAGEMAGLDRAFSKAPTIENVHRAGIDIMGGDPNWKPETQAGKFAELAAENVPLGVGFAVGAGRMAAKGVAAGTRVAGEGFLGRLGDRYATSPLGLVQQETNVNLAASGGQLVARNLAEERDVSPWAKAAYELGGALVGGIGSEVVGATARFGARNIRSAVAPWVGPQSSWTMKLIAGGDDGKENLAARLLKGVAVIDPEEAIANLRRRAEFVPGANALLIPAHATEDRGLLALAASSAMAKTKLGVAYSQAEAEMRDHIGGYFRQQAGSNIPVPPGSGGNVSQETMRAAGDLYKPVFEDIVAQQVAALDERVTLAALEARQEVSKAGGGSTAKISALARKPVEEAYAAARAAGNAIYAMLPNAPATTVRTKAAMDLIDVETKQLGNPDVYPKALADVIKGTNKNLIANEQAELRAFQQQYDMVLKDLNTGGSTDWGAATQLKGAIATSQKRIEALQAKGGKALSDVETTDELRALRAWAGELASEAYRETAGKAGNPRLGKAYRDIAEAIDRDILAAYRESGDEGTVRAAEAADAFNRRINDHFTRGPLSKVRGTDARRADRVDPEEWLTELLGPGDRKGKRGLDKLLDVDAFGLEARQRIGGNGPPTGVSDTPLADISERFLGQHYYDSVTRRGLDGQIEIIPEAHVQFMKKYGAQVEHFPALRANLSDAGLRMDAMQKIAAQAGEETARLRDKNRNVLQLWIEADPDRAVAALRGESTSPLKDAKALVTAAERDPTGQALPALRQVVYEDMVGFARTEGQRDAKGNVLMPGGRMNTYMRENDAMLSVIMTPEQRAAMKNVAAETVAAENRIRTNAVRGQSFSVQQQNMIDEMSKGTTMGALIQAAYGGSRAMGMFANSIPFISTVAQRSEKAVLDGVNEVINRAIFQDRDLLAALLMRPTEKNLPIIRARLRPYFVTAGDSEEMSR